MSESTGYARRGYKGGAKPSTIPAGISNSATTFAGADLSTWAGCAANGPVMVCFDRGLATEEIGEFTTLAGNNVSSLTRGLRGTSAVQHVANCTIELVSTDRDFDEANKLVNAILGISNLAAGDLLELLSATTFGRVAKGTAGQLLGMNDAATGHLRVSTPPLLSFKTAVRVAAPANVTLASAVENGDTIDGVVLATGDSVLLPNQTAGAENGVYVVNASGAPTRRTDCDTAAKLLPSSQVSVSEGTAYKDSVWQLTTNATITVGTTALVFFPIWLQGTGTPEGAVTAPIGAEFHRTDGGAGTSLYVKESGAGNTGWIAYGAGGATFVGARAYRTTAQALTGSAYNAIQMTTESYDTDSIHDTGSNTDRFAVPAGKGGKWLAVGYADINPGALAIVTLYKNGSDPGAGLRTQARNGSSGGGNQQMVVSDVFDLAAGDYISLIAFADGGGQNCNSASLALVKIG